MQSTTTPVIITTEGYTAEIGLRGGQLLALTSTNPSTGAAQDLIVPSGQAQNGFPGAVLAPWPNRIAGAAYVHQETSYQLPVNEEKTGAAIHGLIHDVDFTVEHQREDKVQLTGVLEPSPGYPFRLQLVLAYRVSRFLGLTATLSVRYVPDADADEAEPAEALHPPFGAGFHPYLTAGGAPLKTCRLRLPAATVAKTKSTGKVVNLRSVSGDLDLTASPLLAGLRIDHAYTDLPADGWTAELLHGPSGLMVRMISDTPWAHVYTGDHIDRAGVAVEPMTCPPNAFNSGTDLLQLAPFEWTRVGYSIEAIQL